MPHGLHDALARRLFASPLAGQRRELTTALVPSAVTVQTDELSKLISPTNKYNTRY
jgi:hypothetical protein